MKTNIHFRSYLAQSLLEWEMFETNVVEQLETHVLFPTTFSFPENPTTGYLKVLRPVTSTQVFLGFPVSISKRSDGSQHSQLPLHASHVALRT